jgi:hypothetical protein
VYTNLLKTGKIEIIRSIFNTRTDRFL